MEALTENSSVRTINKPEKLIAGSIEIVLNDARLNILRGVSRNVKVSDFVKTHRCNGCVCVFHDSLIINAVFLFSTSFLKKAHSFFFDQLFCSKSIRFLSVEYFCQGHWFFSSKINLILVNNFLNLLNR
jgi:hypothetical protein